jgi:hypothetical protein
MSTMKDKLTASVRQAKSAQQTGDKKPAVAKRAATPKAVAKPAPKPAAAKPAVPKAAPVAKPAAKPAAPKRAATPGVHAGGIPDSTTTLHPQRVWPD